MLRSCILQRALRQRFSPYFLAASVRSFRCSNERRHGGHSHSPIMEKNEKAREACERVTKLGMWTNGALMIGKGLAGIYGNSHALVADAAHSLSDFASDLVTLYIVKQVRRPHTSKYPYGFGRYEAIGSLAVGSLLVTTSLGILWSSINDLLHQIQNQYFHESLKFLDYLPEVHSHGIDLTSTFPAMIAMSAAIISIISKEWVYRITAKVGEKYNSQVITANAWHHRTDAFSSVIAVIGVGSSLVLGVPWMDTIAGLVVGGMVGKTALSITKESIQDLTDAQVEGPVRNRVKEIIPSVNGVLHFHRLRIRKMGPFYALDMHIVVDPLISVSAAHQIAERVRYEIQEKMEEVTDVLVHVDPNEDKELHHNNDDIRYELAMKKGSVHHEHTEEYLQRPQNEILAEVKAIVDGNDKVGEITHFTCHYLNSRLFVEMEVTMSSNLKISEATNIGESLQAEIHNSVKDIHYIDIHLEILDH